jgi:hypothetical protein
MLTGWGCIFYRSALIANRRLTAFSSQALRHVRFGMFQGTKIDLARREHMVWHGGIVARQIIFSKSLRSRP